MSFDGKPIIDNIKKRGYLYDSVNNCWEPPCSDRFNELTAIDTNVRANKNNRSQGLKMRRVKTGWIDDTLNIKNKNNRFDKFITLVRLDLDLDVWPEFYFTIEKQYRFDYAIPLHSTGAVLRIAIECDGGIHARGNSGHSSPSGIKRDMDKGTLAAVTGWTLIRATPANLCTSQTINLIRRAAENLIHRV